MLGKTHMATGLLVSVITLPIVMYPQQLTAEILRGQFVSFELASLWVGLGVVGSILPDLDEFHSIGTRKVEAVIRIVLILLFVALTMRHHGVTLLSIVVLTAGIVTFFGGENARKIAMLTITVLLAIVGVLYMNFGTGLLIGCMLMAVWSVITAFVGHRTFTHSLTGLALMGVGLGLVLSAVHQIPFVYPLILGYVVHLVADVVSGGIPPLWPMHFGRRKRIGIRMVKTGSSMDHLIGLASLVIAVLVAINTFRS